MRVGKKPDVGAKKERKAKSSKETKNATGRIRSFILSSSLTCHPGERDSTWHTSKRKLSVSVASRPAEDLRNSHCELLGVRTLDDGRALPKHLTSAQKQWLYEEGLQPAVSQVDNEGRPSRHDWRKRASSRVKPGSFKNLKYARRKEVDSGSILPDKYASQIDTYKQRFMPLIDAEQEAGDETYRKRLADWGLERLKREGYCLTDLHAFWLTRTHFGRPIVGFRSEAGHALPSNVFYNGTQVLVSRLDPLKEKPCEGSVVSNTATQINICVEEKFDVEDGVWRLDVGSSNVVFNRMRAAVDKFRSDPRLIERSEENNNRTELCLQGTELRDVLLRMFSADESSHSQPHHLQDPSERQYMGHDQLEHAGRLGENNAGAFRDDKRIQSWAKRYQRINPVVVEGDPTMNRLNETQVRAVATMIGERISLVQGPPGTGKTKTIVEAVKLLKSHFEVPHPILVCTYTNVAVDNLLEGFVDSGLKPLRVGFEGNAKSGLNEFMLEHQFEVHPRRAEYDVVVHRREDLEQEFTALLKLISETKERASVNRSLLERLENMEKFRIQLMSRKIATKAREGYLRQEIFRDIIMKADVICTTCVRSASYALNVVDFPVVFLDEASMSTEPASLIPIMKGCKHLALIGDHKQLPPIVVSREAREGGLDISLFERLTEEGVIPSIMLDTQYRMHPAISRFPSSEFYDLLLLDGTVGLSGEIAPSLAPPVSSHLPEDPKTGHRPSLIFIDHQGLESMKDRSRVNWTEGYIVCNIIEDLLRQNKGLRGEDIGVIAPYKSQIKLITRLLTRDIGLRNHYVAALNHDRAIEIPNIEVKTVDGFEGREKEAIIFSTVRSNASGHIGFLADRRRLNVGLTRAKRALFVVGNMSTLAKGKFGRSSAEEMGNELTKISKGAVAWRNYTQFLNEQNLVLRLRGEGLQRVLKPYVDRLTYSY